VPALSWPAGRDALRRRADSDLRAYFECGLHVERAAERLFVHPNTMRYRLARFEELTGAGLRDPVVAYEVWSALERASLHG